MQKPALTNCIDAVVPFHSASIADYLQKLRTQCAPAVRTLQAENAIAWFSFLIYDQAGADRLDLPNDFPEQFIHFRFSPPKGTPSSELLGRLREPFLHSIPKTLGAIGGRIPTAVGWPEAW
jgi:hypothetical protein